MRARTITLDAAQACVTPTLYITWKRARILGWIICWRWFVTHTQAVDVVMAWRLTRASAKKYAERLATQVALVDQFAFERGNARRVNAHLGGWAREKAKEQSRALEQQNASDGD